MNKSETNRQGDIYGSFLSDGMEFAINAHELQEVVRYQNEMPSVPLSPSYFLGLFSLRDSIVPVVDLRALFEHNSIEIGRESCIAILLVNGVRLGLLFDSTSEVLHIKDGQINKFEYSGGGARSPVSGTISVDRGERLIQILDVQFLLELDRVPLQKSDGFSQEQALRTRKRNKCITFYSAGIRYGFRIDTIREIISMPEIVPSGIKSKTCLGQAELRGTALPVIDFSVLCNGCCSEVDNSEKRIVIANIGEQPVGFLVDKIDSIIEYYLDSLQLLPAFRNDDNSYCLGCISDLAESSISMVDHEKLYSVPEVTAPVEAIAGGNAYKKDRAAASEQAAQRSQTYLMVDVGVNFSLPISSIVEIIEMPSEIVPVALGPAYVKGMFNLRKTLVSIVDLRALYELETASAESKKKLLIVQSQGVYLALMVDSVLDIFSTSETSVHKTPVAMLRSSSQAFKEDASETIMHDSKVTLALNFDSLMARVLCQVAEDELAKAA